MKYRSVLGVLVLGLSSTAMGCAPDVYDFGDSEIVFAIEQSKNAEGKVQTSVGYEFLDVRNHGWSTRGYISAGRSCWAERLDDRLGQPRVEGGVATFQGASLPDKGIAVVANRPDDLVLDAAAWKAGGEVLTFEANGFAMPHIGPWKMAVPSTDLALVAPAEPTGEVALDPHKELEVTWTAPPPSAADRLRESVVASLVAVPEATPHARGVELRCFFDRESAKGQFPKAIMDRFLELVGDGKAPIKGKLRIATHRQMTILAEGGWTVYVVATVAQREQPFSLPRLNKP